MAKNVRICRPTKLEVLPCPPLIYRIFKYSNSKITVNKTWKTLKETQEALSSSYSQGSRAWAIWVPLYELSKERRAKNT